MPSDRVFRTLNRFHRSVMTITFGRLGWRAGGMTVVELTTTGRRTGAPRTVLLTSPVTLGDHRVLVASRGGDACHPDWYLNLAAKRTVTASIAGGPTRSFIARVSTADERADLWPRIVAQYKNYAGYQARTTREIPLVILEPVDDV